MVRTLMFNVIIRCYVFRDLNLILLICCEENILSKVKDQRDSIFLGGSILKYYRLILNLYGNYSKHIFIVGIL